MKHYNNYTECLFLKRQIHLCVWADCNASGALVYAYLHEWIRFNANNPKCRHNGRTWVFKTIDEIHDGIGRVISKRSIQTALDLLVKHRYLVTGDFNAVRPNRTKYYALDRDPDEMPEIGASPESAAVIALKRAMDARNAARRKSKRTARASTFTEEMLEHSFTGTYAAETFFDEYGREFCFAELEEEDKIEVLEGYVEDMERKGQIPNYNHFTTQGVQETLAKRYARIMGTL